MKRVACTFTILITLFTFAFAQAPNAFKYQAVACYSNGDIISDQPVGFQISIIEGEITGNSIYTETHTVNTNNMGIVNIEIGNGTSSDDFSIINWSDGLYFLEISMDTTGGTDYQLMGISQLLSVPYAMHSNGLTLTSPNGHIYRIGVDDLGNIVSDYIPQNEIVSIEFEGTLFVYPEDNSSSVVWGSYGTTINATSTNDGETNTATITSALGDNGGTPYAAYICDTLSAYGFSDWYLPSKDELNAMYNDRFIIGGFTTNMYWSSSEYDDVQSYGLSFGSGMLIPRPKDNNLSVRCVRRD